MSKQYLVRFGSLIPSSYSGLNPTFTVFKTPAGTNVSSPPGITEVPTATGLYYFTYGATAPIMCVIDGATSGLNANERYIVNILDPLDAVDQQITAFDAALSVTLSGLGTSLSILGSTASSYGTTATDPSTVMGYLKRLQELGEGNATFNKGTSVWDIYSRGSSTLLREKLVTNNSTTVVKT